MAINNHFDYGVVRRLFTGFTVVGKMAKK